MGRVKAGSLSLREADEQHPVKLPVRIITPNDVSEIVVPGLTTEISQGGMALYGGVPLQPGDLMEVEFQTSKRLRVAASIRDSQRLLFWAGISGPVAERQRREHYRARFIRDG